jgi:uncharacterized alpha-E superfamily protein
MNDPKRAGGLAWVLNGLARVAGKVRDRISNDMWRVLADLAEHRQAEPRSSSASRVATDAPVNGRRPTLSGELEQLDRIILSLAAFGGLAMESVTRSEGWRFLDMGRKIERALSTIGLVRHILGSVNWHEGPLLEALLELADSSMTYRRRYHGSVHPTAVLDLVLADESNPRSLAFQLNALADDVDHLPRDRSRPGRSPEQRLMVSALSALRLADIELLALVERGRRPHLEELLGRLTALLPILSDAITQTYLSHLQAPRHLSANDMQHAAFGTGPPSLKSSTPREEP